MKKTPLQETRGWQAVKAILGREVIFAFKRHGQWWVIVDGNPTEEMTLDKFMDRKALKYADSGR